MLGGACKARNESVRVFLRYSLGGLLRRRDAPVDEVADFLRLVGAFFSPVAELCLRERRFFAGEGTGVSSAKSSSSSRGDRGDFLEGWEGSGAG